MPDQRCITGREADENRRDFDFGHLDSVVDGRHLVKPVGTLLSLEPARVDGQVQPDERRDEDEGGRDRAPAVEIQVLNYYAT
jgi:hypothetical protein